MDGGCVFEVFLLRGVVVGRGSRRDEVVVSSGYLPGRRSELGGRSDRGEAGCLIVVLPQRFAFGQS